jgi:putative ABC transport system permease protein
MNEVFGLPLSGIMTTLLVMLSVCLLSVAWIAWRRQVIFKLGIRNIPRRKAQTALIVAGLMLSTLIISASLGTGDTMNHSVSAEVYDLLGPVDELVVYSQDTEGNAAASLNHKIPVSALGIVEEALAGNDNVDAIGPMLFETVPVLNETAGQSEPSITLTGIDPSTVDAFGGLKAIDGTAIPLEDMAEDGLVLSEAAADSLNANVGASITIFHANQPSTLTVAAIAPDSVLTGVLDANAAGMVMPLDRLQALTDQPDQLSAIAISNTGGTREGLHLSDEVTEALQPALAGEQLGVAKIKQDSIGQAEELAQIFTSLFLVFGLFSIAAGILLIVLIFTMLAAERRSEMGMARAVGAQRKQLVQQFIAEGMGYALLAGLVGSALGVFAAIGIAFGMRVIIGDYFDIQPHVAPQSMIVAYSLGVVITFIAVVGSSWKVSRLNVVAAVRNIPDIRVAKQRMSGLVWGIVMVLGGALLTLSGLSGDSGAAFFTGMSLLPFGISFLLRYLGVPTRPVFTLVGIYVLALWLLPEDAATALFGTYDAGMEMFFLSGIFVVAATTLVIVQNLGTLLTLLSLVGGMFRSKLPAIRTAVAYPGAARDRTGMTIAMFSLMIFSLVMVATINQNFSAIFLGDDSNAGWDVRADVGSANPIENFEQALAAEGVDTSEIAAMGQVTMPNSSATQLRMPGATEWENYPIVGMEETFMSESALLFQQRAEGYESDQAIVKALQTEPNVAVIDSFAVPSGSNIAGDEPLFQLQGIAPGDTTFTPITIEVADPDSSTPATVTIIGVIASKVGSLHGLYSSQQTIDGIFPESGFTSYFIALENPEVSDQVAKNIEAAMLSNGAQVVSIQDELQELQSQSTGLLYIIQGFMGLGLIVGVAAVGVIAFRSVVERRQQIGVLRALGYQRSLVALSFVIESSFVVVLGVVAGVSTGLFLAYNLMHSESFGGSEDITFLVPWGLLSVIIAATVVAALLMTWLPARQASGIAPAEALRYE